MDAISPPRKAVTTPVRYALVGGALALYVLASSWLGLNGLDVAFSGEHGSWQFFVDVWSDTVAADVMFAGGSVFAAVAAYRLAQRQPLAYACAAGLAMGWWVYFGSYTMLAGDLASAKPRWENFTFVAGWGWLGLVFAALAPPLAARVVAWRSGQPLPDARRAGLGVALVAAFTFLVIVFAGPSEYVGPSPGTENTGLANPVQDALWAVWGPGTLVLGFGLPAVGVLAYGLARRGRWLPSVGAALVLSWALFAFALMTRAGTLARTPGAADAARAVGMESLPAVLFAALAPAAAAWGLARLREDVVEAPAAEAEGPGPSS